MSEGNWGAALYYAQRVSRSGNHYARSGRRRRSSRPAAHGPCWGWAAVEQLALWSPSAYFPTYPHTGWIHGLIRSGSRASGAASGWTGGECPVVSGPGVQGWPPSMPGGPGGWVRDELPHPLPPLEGTSDGGHGDRSLSDRHTGHALRRCITGAIHASRMTEVHAKNTVRPRSSSVSQTLAG